MPDAIDHLPRTAEVAPSPSAEATRSHPLTSQLQRMGKLLLPAQEEQPLQRSSSFVNTHLSLTKVVRGHVLRRSVRKG